jgi:hypothetical protein
MRRRNRWSTGKEILENVDTVTDIDSTVVIGVGGVKARGCLACGEGIQATRE